MNEYVCGEGIAKHVDTHSAFEDGIASLSLGSHTVISFAHATDPSLSVDVFIPPRSLFIMTGESRYLFTHQMPQRRTDKVDEEILARDTRLSVTFRMTKAVGEKCGCEYKVLCDTP